MANQEKSSAYYESLGKLIHAEVSSLSQKKLAIKFANLFVSKQIEADVFRDTVTKMLDAAADEKYDLENRLKNVSKFGIESIERMADASAIGEKFTRGRKVGTKGPISKAIAAAIKKKPNIKNAELWRQISAKPPRGWTAYDTARLGKYLEGPSNANVSYKRFCNIAAEERKANAKIPE